VGDPSGAGNRRESARTWRERVDELLLAGERVRERVTVGDHAFVVTSHRVLSFGPGEGDEPRFRAVDRPNVVAVRIETHDPLRLLGWAGIFGVVGTVLLLIGLSIDFGGLVPGVGAGPAAEALRVVTDALSALLAAFGRLLVWTGTVVVLAGVAVFVTYVRGRHERLVVAVDGETNLTAPRPTDPDRTVYTLERAIEDAPPVHRAGLVGVHIDGTDRHRPGASR